MMFSPALTTLGGPAIHDGGIDPAKVPGLLAWFDARFIDPSLDGTPLFRWPELTGKLTVRCIQGTTSKRGVFHKNYNGHGPSVLFDGIDDFMFIEVGNHLWPAIDAGKWTMFMKHIPVTDSGGYRTLIKPQLPTSPWDPGILFYGTNKNYATARLSSGGNMSAGAGTFSYGKPTVVVGRWDLANGTFSVTTDGNSASNSYPDKTSVLGSNNEIYIGASWAGGGFCNTAIQAFGFFDRPLSDTEVEYLLNA